MAFSLADMLKEVSNPDTGREQIEYIRLDLIDSDVNNFYQLSDIEGLADNIAFAGLQQPIRVRKNPNNDRYTIISGHRRRAAIELLAKDEPEKWQEVSCIVQQDAASPALQQLQLIFANSSTRKLTDAEISEQAAQVKNLLYQLKENEGYEFTGRMRDHVAEIVKVSKSKLARLEAIRNNLSAAWLPYWNDGTLSESTAYELSKISVGCQTILFEEKARTNANIGYLYADDVKKFSERVSAIVARDCTVFGRENCGNQENKMRKAAVADRFGWFHCDTKCCRDCPELIRCQRACPKLKETIKQLKADAKEAAKQEAATKAKAEKPVTDKISALWQRFGLLRELASKDWEDVRKALGIYYLPYEADKAMKLECGEAKVSPETKLPFGYSCYLSEIARIIAIADLFGCSLDYLLCRTDDPDPKPAGNVLKSDTEEKEPVFIPGAWYAASVEPPVGEKLILMDSGGYVDTGKYKGCGEYDMDYGDPVVLWTPMPEEKDVVTSSPVSHGWNTSNPEAYGTYVAYVLVDGAARPIIRELLWDGECWYLHGDQIHDDVTVQCWAERPEF